MQSNSILDAQYRVNTSEVGDASKAAKCKYNTNTMHTNTNTSKLVQVGDARISASESG